MDDDACCDCEKCDKLNDEDEKYTSVSSIFSFVCGFSKAQNEAIRIIKLIREIEKNNVETDD